MRYRRRALWALAIAVSILLLVAPAVWNGFPLLQYDTGGYLARWYEGYLVPSRAVTYGLMLTAGVPFAFWPVLLVQAALTVWIVALVLRAHGLSDRPLLLAGAIATLSILTTLPFLTAVLLTDIFCGLAVLALYLLLLRGESLSRREQWGLIIFIAVAASTHSATFALLGGLTVCAGLLRVAVARRLAARRLRQSVLALALGAAIVFAGNVVVAGKLTWTPGGFALSFGRMLQDGIVNKYLDEHCPDRTLRLCAFKNDLPQNADEWFWGSSLFDQLGRFDGLGKEMERITLDALVSYPGLQLKTALADTGEQLIDVHTGEGVVDHVWHTYGIVARYTPQLAPAMRAARQQNGELSFDAINRLHYPIALLAMALLPVIIVLAFAGVMPPTAGELAGTVSLAVLGNAFICGVLSNPHDRYGARVVWLAVFAALVALTQWLGRRRHTLN